ncbi:hypothetical protein FB451DRAFT_1168732 [Mycena latifolia]|nr:hypothetical protein FB451DRAFT_1168732 [Mycena latifolia]
MYALGTRCYSNWRDFGSIADGHANCRICIAGTIMTAGGVHLEPQIAARAALKSKISPCYVRGMMGIYAVNSLDSRAHHGLAREHKKQPRGEWWVIYPLNSLDSWAYHGLARAHEKQPVEGKNPKKIPCGAGSGSTRWEKPAGSTQSDSSLDAPIQQWVDAPTRTGVPL